MQGALQTTRDNGSSPRVRGKRREGGLAVLRVGLIPACAGKTWTHVLRPPAATAHPRVCGENARPAHARPPGEGSSPRVRGKLGHILGGRIERGLIPACAGKTSKSS